MKLDELTLEDLRVVRTVIAGVIEARTAEARFQRQLDSVLRPNPNIKEAAPDARAEFVSALSIIPEADVPDHGFHPEPPQHIMVGPEPGSTLIRRADLPDLTAQFNAAVQAMTEPEPEPEPEAETPTPDPAPVKREIPAEDIDVINAATRAAKPAGALQQMIADLDAVENQSGFDKIDELSMIERLWRGEKLTVIADALGCHFQAVRHHSNRLLANGRGDLDKRALVLKALRARAGLEVDAR